MIVGPNISYKMFESLELDENLNLQENFRSSVDKILNNYDAYVEAATKIKKERFNIAANIEELKSFLDKY